jgi:tetratricopeptide (TPR) repeat protein
VIAGRKNSSFAKALSARAADIASARESAEPLCWLIPALVFLITGIVFAPVAQNQFVNWDDNVNLLENPYYRGLGLAQLHWMFTTFHNSLYRPLTWMTLGADYLLWGMRPAGYHLTSLLFHCANALLFYFLALRIFSIAARPPVVPGTVAMRAAAAFAALMFALHPLRVEPIAWASGRENVVSGFFFILTLICYLKAAHTVSPGSVNWRWMGAAWVSYALSLLGKGAVVTLPFALLVLDVYPLKRLGWDRGFLGPEARRIWREKVPFFVLAVCGGVLALFGKQQSKLLYGLDQYGLMDRIVQAVYGFAFYLWKTLVPIQLSPLYEMRTLEVSDWRFLLSTMVLLAITAALWFLRQRWPWALAAWVYYLVIVAPYIGLAQNGPQIAADRYSYLACLGWTAQAGAGLLHFQDFRMIRKAGRRAFALVAAAIGMLIVVLGFLTWRQTLVWHTSETLWRHALTIDPESFFAHSFLGTALFESGKTEEAIGHLNQALALNPGYASAHHALANAFSQRGELEQAIKHYHQTLALDPGSAKAHYNLGLVHARREEWHEAVAQYREALKIDPSDPDYHNNLGLALAKLEKWEDAIEQFRTALRIDPDYFKAHFNLGRVYAHEGKPGDAVQHFTQALRLQPESPEIHQSLGRVLHLEGKKEEALHHYEEAIRLLKLQPASTGAAK